MVFAFVRSPGIAQKLGFGLEYIVMIAPVVVLFLVAQVIPFEQVVIRINTLQFQTCYNLGGLKFRVREFNYGGEVRLEQDKDRYYCLFIKLADGQKLLIERIPTRDVADRRLEELKGVMN